MRGQIGARRQVGLLDGIEQIYELTPLRIELTWWTLPLILVAQDFFYYWSHRSHHVIRILWASHVVHHSSQRYNLSTALRQTWTGVTSFVFYLPLVAFGVHPAVVAFIGSINLVYQFWIHTERIDRLPRPIEAVWNTPSHHRVHHASQGSYLDRNFGGMLIVVFERNVDAYLYWNTIAYWVVIKDSLTGIGKSVVFGALVTLIGCYNGLATEGGTEGLGRSTTATVVQVAMGVIISDFFLTKFFLFLFW